MCSRKGAAVRGGGRDHPVSLVGRLHELLDALLGSDLDDLTADDQGRLVCRLVEAQQRLHAATAQAVGAFDGADVAIASRHRTTVRWLEHRTRLSAGAAAHLTRTARALRDHLPATHEALAGGRITSQHVAAVVSVVRTVGPEHASAAEPVLLDLARRGDPATVRRATAALFAAVDPAGAEKALHTAYEKRGLQVSVAGEHGYLDGVLDLESTELLQSALMPLMAPAGPADTRSAAQRRADALLDIVTKRLGTEEMPVVGGHRPHLSVVVDADQLPPDTPAPGDTGFGEDGFGGDRSPGSVRSRRGWVGTVTLPWTGVALPATVARRWACHAAVTPVVSRLLPRPRQHVTGVERPVVTIDPAWLPLGVGRTQRTVTAAQLKALVVRDGGCVHPGCSRAPAFCDAHHVRHWVDGGVTALTNLVLLCRHHHRTLHAGCWQIRPDPGTPGLFWTSDHDGLHQAQTAHDRSPPLRPVA